MGIVTVALLNRIPEQTTEDQRMVTNLLLN